MTEKEISRKQRWRLGIIRHAEEVTHNVAKTCRYFGISRTAFYKWYERYQNDGVEGLKDRSCRPLKLTFAAERPPPAQAQPQLAMAAEERAEYL